MSWVRKNPVFAASLLVLGLTVLVEAGLIGERWAAARAVRKRLEGVGRELRALAALAPAPTPENAARIEADLGRARQERAALQADLAPPAPEASRQFSRPVPARRPDAFFDLADFVESTRARARQAGVLLRADERFGFSAYVHEAPEAGQIAAVFRERVVVHYLMEALLTAQPHQLVSIQREHSPELAGIRGRGNPAGSPAAGMPGAAGSDYFAIDPRLSLRMPEVIETTAFRLTFTGHTATLRALLNKLAEFELPVVVRAVEVAPADRLRDDPAPARPEAQPLVASPWSRFTVTVEFVALASRPKAAF